MDTRKKYTLVRDDGKVEVGTVLGEEYIPSYVYSPMIRHSDMITKSFSNGMFSDIFHYMFYLGLPLLLIYFFLNQKKGK